MFSSFKSHRTRKPSRFLPFLEELETRALPSTYVSTNWSGYGVESPNFTNPAGHVVNGVSAKWTVPTVSNNNSFGWSSTWVGIDGFSSNTVEQIGTEQDTALTSLYYGMPQYYAWIEMYPAYPVALFTVSPGDTITASVVYTGPAGDTTSNSPFLLTITDVTS
ncbi:MAG TPA: G1 family glutamic endopeptidase, partial [Gemmataceae bacterium]|nr:G1 family glutamic endopeptidase [Gemmataceae bacterium]